MATRIQVRDIDFEKLEAEVATILAEVDRGEHDTVLKAAGVRRNRDAPVSGSVTLTTGQGLSPDQWAEIVVAFAPAAAAITESIWKIVVEPALKRVFRDDRVRNEDDAS